MQMQMQRSAGLRVSTPASRLPCARIQCIAQPIKQQQCRAAASSSPAPLSSSSSRMEAFLLSASAAATPLLLDVQVRVCMGCLGQGAWGVIDRK